MSLGAPSSGYIPQHPSTLPLPKPKHSNKWKVSREDFAWDLALLLWTNRMVEGVSMVKSTYNNAEGFGKLGMVIGWQYGSNIINKKALERVVEELNPLRQLTQAQIQMIGDIFDYQMPLFGEHGYLVIDISHKERSEFSRFRSKFRSLAWSSVMWLKPHHTITPELSESLDIVI